MRLEQTAKNCAILFEDLKALFTLINTFKISIGN
jgi:hypothetical protein